MGRVTYRDCQGLLRWVFLVLHSHSAIGRSADRRLWVTGVLFGNSMSLLGEGGLGMDLGFENDDPEESEGDQHWLERSWV